MLVVCGCSVPVPCHTWFFSGRIGCRFVSHLCEAQALWQGTTLKSLQLRSRRECVTCSKFSFPPPEVGGVCWGQAKRPVWGGTLRVGWLCAAERVSAERATKGGQGLSSFWHTTCPRTISHSPPSDAVLRLITSDLGLHLSLTPSGYCFQCLDEKKNQMSLSVEKDQTWEHIFLPPHFLCHIHFPIFPVSV